MDVFHLEDLRLELQKKLTEEKAPIIQFKLLNQFFKYILNQNFESIKEAYLTEFIPIYLNVLNSFDPIGINPQTISNDLKFLKNINEHKVFAEYSSDLQDQFLRINSQIDIINSALNGEEIDNPELLLSFPVKIKSQKAEDEFGQIEKFTVKIHKESSLTENKFLIVPSYKEIDKELLEQIKSSWDLAINYLNKFYKNANPYHEVVLFFSQKYGQLEGYSLGFAITLGFIQELFKFYNTSLSLSLNGNVTFTGGFSSNKEVKALNEKIISQKTETIFFSSYSYFVIPEPDLISAKIKLNILKIQYPNRNLKLISVDDFDDLINHRQIINIEKAKIIERTNKLVKKNKYVLLLTLILLTILSFLTIYSVDNNPREFKVINQTVHIVNKHGKILWSTKQNFTKDGIILGTDDKYTQLLYDIDKDGINEVILAQEYSDEKDNSKDKSRKISCYNNFGEEIWSYLFADTISTKNEVFDPNDYINFILGIVEEKDKTVLLGVSRQNYFPSAIYKLDIETGKRLEGTLWSQGHFHWRGSVGDFNNDGKTEIFIGGISNKMESAFVLFVDYDSLNGQTPNEIELFNNRPIANLGQYILIGKSDIANYLNLRFNSIIAAVYSERMKDFYVNSHEGYIKQPIGLVYRFKKDFSQIKTQIGDDLLFIRDSLVVKEILKPPFTNDPEYSKILISGIKKWNGKKFVKFLN